MVGQWWIVWDMCKVLVLVCQEVLYVVTGSLTVLVLVYWDGWAVEDSLGQV